MAKYIIGFGEQPDVDVIEADTLDAALQVARDRSTAVGVDAEAMDDCSWSKAYDTDLAQELGLLVIDERDAGRLAWKSQAPWR